MTKLTTVLCVRALFISIALALAGPVFAAPVTYTAYVVTDGRLGWHAFHDAQVTITMQADTRDMSVAVENGATVYTNQGQAMVTIAQGGITRVAHIAPGQIYARFDATNYLVGFGSSVGSLYPLVIACVDAYDMFYGQTCLDHGGYDYILDALFQIAHDPSYSYHWSSNVYALGTTLSDPSFLTGNATSCAQLAVSADGNSIICPSAPSTPIKTDAGDLYFQDGQLLQPTPSNFYAEGLGLFTIVKSSPDD